MGEGGESGVHNGVVEEDGVGDVDWVGWDGGWWTEGCGGPVGFIVGDACFIARKTCD